MDKFCKTLGKITVASIIVWIFTILFNNTSNEWLKFIVAYLGGTVSMLFTTITLDV